MSGVPLLAAALLGGALLGGLFTGAFVRLADARGWGKSVRRDGPQGHLVKEGTPTMGGVAFLLAALPLGAALALALPGDAATEALALALLSAAAGALGLLDDALSLARKRRAARGEDASTGLLARWRLLGQGALALAFGAWASARGEALLGPAWLDALAFAFVIVGTVNAVNFSDGLDGLAAGMTAIMLLLFVGSPLAAALLGALLGFLWFNAHPARVFMGGVGSEALGAALAGLAILQGMTWYLPLLALVPLLEVLSVMLQVSWFRATGGRRILKMSPLHHHFELSGWSETQVVLRFWLATALATAATWGLRAALAGGAA